MSQKWLTEVVRHLWHEKYLLKAIDNWALSMTIFILMNPDQEYPFKLEVKEQQNTKKQTSQLNLLHQHLKEKLPPSPMQTRYLQKIRELFNKVSSQKNEKQCID